MGYGPRNGAGAARQVRGEESGGGFGVIAASLRRCCGRRWRPPRDGLRVRLPEECALCNCKPLTVMIGPARQGDVPAGGCRGNQDTPGEASRVVSSRWSAGVRLLSRRSGPHARMCGVATNSTRTGDDPAGAERVEVRQMPGGSVAVRDRADPAQSWLVFTPEEWAAFIAGVKNGEFDPV